MFETAGALAIVQPVLLLVGLVGLPLVWTIVAATSAWFEHRTRTRGGASNVRGVIAPIVAISCAVSTLGLAIISAGRLAFLPRGHVLVQHVAQLARLGQLDLAFDFAVDPRGATFIVVAGVVAVASVLHTTMAPASATSTTSAKLTWTGLLTTGAMAFCAGDGFAPILVGLGLLSLGAWGLSRGADLAPNIASLGGNVGVLLGCIFLFWSLGGAFGPEGYDPDGAPRFVLVATNTPAAEPDKATFAMTTHAGALVSSDDGDLPREPIASPFAISVDPGVHTLRVQSGAASGDVVVPRVAFVAGRTYVLTPYGPTASFRALDDQFAVPRLAPSGTAASVRAALAARTINGLRASAVVLLLVLGGALAHLHALASRRGPSTLACVLEAVPAPWLAIRLAPVVEPGAADGALVVLLGTGSAAVLAARASCVDDGHKALRGVLAATASVAVAASGLGDPSATLILACTTLLASAAALAAIEARRDARWLGMACAGAAGLLPGAGAFPGWMSTALAALGSASTTAAAWAFFAGGVAFVLLATCTLASLAAFRVYDAVIRASARDPGESRGQGAIVIVLAVLGLVAGIALGVGTTMFGGHVVPLARKIAGGTAFSAPRTVAALAFILSLASAAMGVFLARRASASTSPPRWLLALGRPYAILAWTASGVGQGMRFLQRSVVAMDRDVVEDIPIAIRDLLLRCGRGLVRLGQKVSGKVEPPLDRAAAAVVVKLEMDDPRTVERVRTVAVLVMVALLGLVVLSSLLLG